MNEATTTAANLLSDRLKFGQTVARLLNLSDAMTPVQQDVTSEVIITNLNLDITGDKSITSVVKELMHQVLNKGMKSDDAIAVVSPIIDCITKGDYIGVSNLMIRATTPAPAVEPTATATTATMTESATATTADSGTAAVNSEAAETGPSAPTKRRRRSTSPSISRTISIPELVIPPTTCIPDIAVVPTDPMSVMAQTIAKHMGPMIEAHARSAGTAAIGHMKPVVDAIRSEIAIVDSRITAAAAPSGKSGIDADAVSEIVEAKLHNGAGEMIRKSVSTITPAVFSDVLARAADAVGAMAPADHSKVSLTAAMTIDPDPNYAWTDETKAIADLIAAASVVEPQNALLVGPTGSGKTEMAMQFAAKHGKPCIVMDCANLREAREWFGVKGVAGGATFFRKSQFWLAVEAGNCVVILDEFNRAPDHVRNPLMPILDHRRRSFVEEVGEMLVVGPGTVFFATLNEGLDYTGTHTTDRAMKNRFPRRIEIDYLPEKQERKVLLSKVAGLSEEDAKRLVELATTIRAKATGFAGGLSETISTRQLIAAAKDFVIGGPKTFKNTIFAHFNADGGTDSERAQVVNSFQLKGYILS